MNGLRIEPLVRSASRASAVPALLVALLFALFLSACSDQEIEAVRSIDEIHDEEGVPVSVRSLEPTEFRTYLSFTTNVSGASESSASAMLADTVTGVLYEVGDYVQKDTAVVVFPTDNPTLKYEQARVGFQSAQTAFQRIQQLYEDDGVSQQTYDDARTQLEIARANWNSVQSMVRVKAPISGYITRLNVLESDNVNPGDPLFTVADPRELKTTVWLTDRQVGSVSVGQTAVARWQGIEIEGEVVQVDMAMDQNRKAFATKLRCRNTNLAVISGVTVVVEIETYRNNDALILNQREIVESEDERFVYVVHEDTALRRPIRVTHRQGLIAEVDLELNPGEKVITRGIEMVADGTLVRVVNEETRLVQR